MSVESDLSAALELLLPGKVYPDLAPQGAVAPYIVYQQAGGESPSFLENATPTKRNARMQVSVWGTTRAAVIALALQIEQAVVTTSTLNGRPLSAFVSLYDEDTKLRGATQDFSIWGNRA